MPLWGRPPGARGSVRRQVWEREQVAWQEQARIQELDSDDDYSYGVGDLAQKRFASDPLHFTGTDIGARPRRSYIYGGSDSSGDTDELGDGSDMQMALRDKEEAMVEGALARIRRAQEKGKKDVKLSPEELAALERRRKRMQSAEKRRGSGDRRRHDDRIAVPLSQLEPLSRKVKARRDETPPPSGPPGMLVQGPDGTLSYAPIGQPPSNRGSPGSRPRSSTQTRETPPQLPRQHMPSAGRHFSDGTRPNSSGRPLPHEDSWQPRPQGNSLYAVDPFEYQVFDSDHSQSIPSQYLDPRRNVSGPEIQYATRPVSSSRPVSNVYPASASMRGNQAASHSDPSLARRQVTVDFSSEDSSDELGNGVRVERESSSSSVPRKPVAKAKRRGHR